VAHNHCQKSALCSRVMTSPTTSHAMATDPDVAGAAWDAWLVNGESAEVIAKGICDRRDRSIQGISGPAGHVS